jgi:hypothetical protein
MALDTITLSDLGKSLCEIDQQIRANNSNISCYRSMANELAEKNEVLYKLAQQICELNLPSLVQFQGKVPF